MLQARVGPGAEEPAGKPRASRHSSVALRDNPPIPGASSEEAADWVELAILARRRRACAMEDLLQAMRAVRLPDDAWGSGAPARNRRIEAGAAGAFAELQDRRLASRQGYPFRLAGDVLEGSRGMDRVAYTFLLLLSAFGAAAGPPEVDGASLFEEVSAAAGASYLGGRRAGARFLVFGSPRRGPTAGFRGAVDHLCESIGEGGGCRPRMRLHHQRDAKLDVVVWRSFPDGRAGQVIGFGQCATGRSWPAKLHELQPRAFANLWFREPLTVEPLRLFFVPFRVDRARWEEASFYGGMLFDRCRIAAHSDELETDVLDRCQVWSRHVIRTRLRR